MSKRKIIGSTDRTVIVEIELDDAAFFFELMRSPGFIKYIGDRKLVDLQQAEQHVQEYFLDFYQKRGFGHYLVQNLAGQSMGAVGFLKKSYLQYEDFGFAFLPEFCGQGLAGEASRFLLNYAGARLGLKVLDAITVPDNQASRGLLEKLGFIDIGTVCVPDDPEQLCLYRWNA